MRATRARLDRPKKPSRGCIRGAALLKRDNSISSNVRALKAALARADMPGAIDGIDLAWEVKLHCPLLLVGRIRAKQSILGIDPFDQPDVEASNIATRKLTDE